MSGIADPFNGHIDEFRTAHVQRSDGWIATTVNGDTDYIASGTVGDLDLYEVGDLPFTPDTIHAVEVTMCARKDDAASREVRSKIKSGATTANGAPHALTDVYYRDIFEIDPNTSTAWTSGGVNALQIGPEVVT